ncbi:MAG TPA: hypothetical protein VFI31_10825 [Pirellulales bacterium]|nr:hypothetical protein [Pirellulales bacterium]
MPRRFQFSLKWFFVATTIMAICAAFWPRQAERLEILVDSFNHSIHDGQYHDAVRIAARTRFLYPDALVGQQMQNICKMMQRRTMHKKR